MMKYCVAYENNGVTIDAYFENEADAQTFSRLREASTIYRLLDGEFDASTGLHSGTVIGIKTKKVLEGDTV